MQLGSSTLAADTAAYCASWGRSSLARASRQATLTARRSISASGTFGAAGVYASTDPREIRFEDKFNLIWVGSVFTHIDETAWEGLLRVLAAALADDGLLIFTTEGPAVADTLREGELDFGLAPDAVQSILRDFAESGFGYGDYANRERHDFPSSGRYGVTVVHPDQVRALVRAAGLEVAHYIATGWDNHQDVFACRLAASMG